MVYDYAIGGAGAAGLQLALAMANDDFFAHKQILIIEPSAKVSNDKRWCFWEPDGGLWDDLIEYRWRKVAVRSDYGQFVLPLKNYQYKMLRAEDFYAFAKNIVLAKPNITWVKDRVVSVQDGVYPLCLEGKQGTYFARHFFDSRVEDPPGLNPNQQVHLYQHFLGWEVETDTDAFQPDLVELMDFRSAKPNTCSFMYVLPFSKRKALVEFTVFSPSVWGDDEYEKPLRQYLQNKAFRIVGKEAGIIPMSTIPFHEAGGEHHTKIGTAGSWVKPSTGYSFMSSSHKVKQVIANIKAGKSPNTDLIKPRFRYYDRLLLDILERNNGYGPKLFDTLYRKNDITTLFRFLDEQTTFQEEIGIMASFNPFPFLYSILRSAKALLIRNV